MATGTRASSKKISQNISSPVMSRIGRMSMPGASRSTISAVMPSCLRLSAMAVGIGAHEEQAPLGDVGGRDPDLLAVEHVVVAVGDRDGAQVGEVAAGLRLAEALAPVVVGVEDVGDPPLLLLVGAPADDHRADLPQAVGVVDAGRAVARHRLGVDDVLGDRRVAAAPLGRPAMAAHRPSLSLRCQARRRSICDRIPPPPAGAALSASSSVAAASSSDHSARNFGQVLVEPVDQLVAERLVLVGVGEVHRRRA